MDSAADIEHGVLLVSWAVSGLRAPNNSHCLYPLYTLIVQYVPRYVTLFGFRTVALKLHRLGVGDFEIYRARCENCEEALK